MHSMSWQVLTACPSCAGTDWCWCWGSYSEQTIWPHCEGHKVPSKVDGRLETLLFWEVMEEGQEKPLSI